MREGFWVADPKSILMIIKGSEYRIYLVGVGGISEIH